MSVSWQCLFAGSCWLLKSFVEDITNDLSNSNLIDDEPKNYRNNRKRFCTILLDLCEVKELSKFMSIKSRYSMLEVINFGPFFSAWSMFLTMFLNFLSHFHLHGSITPYSIHS